jgi:hypothetical protein
MEWEGEPARLIDLVDRLVVDAFVPPDCSALVLVFENDEKYVFCHEPECCEIVTMDRGFGAYGTLVGRTIRDIVKFDSSEDALHGIYNAYTRTTIRITTDTISMEFSWLGKYQTYCTSNVDVMLWHIVDHKVVEERINQLATDIRF